METKTCYTLQDFSREVSYDNTVKCNAIHRLSKVKSLIHSKECAHNLEQVNMGAPSRTIARDSIGLNERSN